MYYRVDKDYLAHHGILGQKWGVRRYQNEDGSLTSAGRKRYKEDAQKAKGYEKQLRGYEKESVNNVATYNKHDMAYNRYNTAAEAYRQKNKYAKADKYEAKAKSEDTARSEAYKKMLDSDSKIWKTAYKAVKDGFDVKVTDTVVRYRDKTAVGSTIVSSLLGGAAVAAGTFFAPGAGTAGAMGAAYGLVNGTRMANDLTGHTQNIDGKKYSVYKSKNKGIGNIYVSDAMLQENAIKAIFENRENR